MTTKTTAQLPAELTTLLTLQDKLFEAKLYQPRTNGFGDLEIQKVSVNELVKEIMDELRAKGVFGPQP